MSENENKVQAACTLGVGAEILQNYMDARVEQITSRQQTNSSSGLENIGVIALGELTSIGLKWLAKSLGV